MVWLKGFSALQKLIFNACHSEASDMAAVFNRLCSESHQPGLKLLDSEHQQLKPTAQPDASE
jgi:hypothetical protein